jgi:hypothetical protein
MIGEGAELFSGDDDVAARWLLLAKDQSEKGRLTGAREPDEEYKLPLENLQVDSI